MNIKHKETETKGEFFIEVDNEKLAHITYSKLGQSKIIIDHTEVTEKLRGTGAGKDLVMASGDYASKHQLKIIPLCPFAKIIFDENRHLQDVLK